MAECHDTDTLPITGLFCAATVYSCVHASWYWHKSGMGPGLADDALLVPPQMGVGQSAGRPLTGVNQIRNPIKWSGAAPVQVDQSSGTAPNSLQGDRGHARATVPVIRKITGMDLLVAPARAAGILLRSAVMLWCSAVPGLTVAGPVIDRRWNRVRFSYRLIMPASGGTTSSPHGFTLWPTILCRGRGGGSLCRVH